MATATGGRSRVINFKKFLEKTDQFSKEAKFKSKPRQEQDIFMQTCKDIKELYEKEWPEEELNKRRQTIIHKVKGREQLFPPQFLKEFEETFREVEYKEKKKEEGVKSTGSKPGTPDNDREDNQGVNAGPAPLRSAHSPIHKRKIDVNKPGGNPDTEHLQQEIARLTKELDKNREELKNEKHLSEDRKKQLDDLEPKVETQEKRIKELEEETENLSNRFEKENKELTKVRHELSSKQTMNEQLEAGLNDYVSREEKFRKDIDQLTFQNKKLEKDKSTLEKSRQRDMERFQDELNQEVRKHDDQYKKLMAERDDLRDRFSKLAGAKLQEKNADIADLSDPNRAMKLSEKFGQIYDDEWTNAFEVLTDRKAGLQLKDAINFLLRLLQECWSYCNTLMNTQMESVHSMFLLPAQNVAKFDQKKMGKKIPPRISSKDNQTLYDLRRKIGVFPAVVEEVKEALLAESKRWDKQKIGYDTKYVDACAPYIQKCAEICWLMALHDPPLYMKMEVKPGEKLDQNIYSVYSSSGNSIDFLVWPPLYNGKDGGLLAKGVVEPQKTIGKKK